MTLNITGPTPVDQLGYAKVTLKNEAVKFNRTIQWPVSGQKWAYTFQFPSGFDPSKGTWNVEVANSEVDSPIGFGPYEGNQKGYGVQILGCYPPKTGAPENVPSGEGSVLPAPVPQQVPENKKTLGVNDSWVTKCSNSKPNSTITVYINTTPHEIRTETQKTGAEKGFMSVSLANDSSGGYQPTWPLLADLFWPVTTDQPEVLPPGGSKLYQWFYTFPETSFNGNWTLTVANNHDLNLPVTVEMLVDGCNPE